METSIPMRSAHRFPPTTLIETLLQSTSSIHNNTIIYSTLIFILATLRSKHQLKVSLIGNSGSQKPQIVKSPVQAESQFDKKERGKALRQVVAAFIVNIGTINTGLIFGFSAVVIPQLLDPLSSIQIDKNQASWIGELFGYFNYYPQLSFIKMR